MLIPVILSGGSGTRLWPVSRETSPKPFIALPDGDTLLRKAYKRAAAIADIPEIVTVTNRDHYFRTKDEYRASGVAAPAAYLLEPFGRNTGPALACAAFYVCEHHGGNALVLAMPADQLVTDMRQFAIAVDKACQLAEDGFLVTFGIRPTSAATGFGYIHVGEPRRNGFVVNRFVEKPPLEVAQQYVDSGQYLWNAGIFCFRADTMLAALKAYCPEIYDAAKLCWDEQRREPGLGKGVYEIEASAFEGMPDIAIDYAVMERASNVAVVVSDMGWSDIGTWSSLCELVESDANGNRSLGEAVIIDSRDTFVQSEHHLVAAVGVHELIIVDTPDAVLVAHRDKAEDVRKVVNQLKHRGHEAYRAHRTIFRPWGSFTVLEEGQKFKIKRLEVRPGAALSLQLHHHRSEHWVVVSGIAKVVNGDREFYLRANESTYIPVGQKHRLENPGKLDLIIIEVQCGDYLGEDDIVRIEDRFGRSLLVERDSNA